MRSTTNMRLEDCAAVSQGLIRINVLTQGGDRVSRLARLVDVAPHITSATFAVHEAIGEPGWAVTDVGSGARASRSADSEADAVSLAAAALAIRTDDDMARARAKLRRPASVGSA